MFERVKERRSDNIFTLILDMLPSFFLILFSFITTNMKGGTLFTLAAFLVATNIPALSISKMLGNRLGMSEDEMLVINFILGNCLLNLVYIYLNTLLSNVTRTKLMTVLCIISVITGIWKNRYGEHNKSSAKYVNILPKYIGAFLSLIPGIYSINKSLTLEYWRGEDPFGLAVCAREIVANNFSPMEAYYYFIGYFQLFTSGFYYHVASIMTVTGAHEDILVRYGGVIIGGTLTTLTYVTVKRFTNATGGILAASFIFLNPYMVLRFSSPLREYYGYLILITFLFLIHVRSKSSERFCPSYVLTLAMMLGTALVNHSITPIFIIGVLGVDLIGNLVKKRYSPIHETIILCVFALLLSTPYIQIIYIPVLKLLSISLSSLVLYGSIGFVLFCALLVLVKDKLNKETFEVSNPVKLLFLFFLSAIFILSIYYPPDLGNDFNFNYITNNQFSSSLSWISIIGFLLLAYYDAPTQIYALAFQIAAIIGFSFLGIKVPLDRLSAYVTWIMSYATAQLIVKLLEVIKLEPLKIDILRLGPNGIKKYVQSNMYAIILLLIILSPFIREAGQIRQSPRTYDPEIINAASEFIETLEPGDLVIPNRLLLHLVFYAGTPHENTLNQDLRGTWMKQFYSSESVYEMSDWIQETQPEAKRIHFYTYNSIEKTERFGTLSEEIMEDYGKERKWGETRSFTFDIPFTLDTLPIENVRYIGEGVKIVSSQTEQGEKIIETSNVLYDPTHTGKEFIIFYTIENISGIKSLRQASSSDGVNWVRNENLVITGLSDPYLVKQDMRYFLFAINDKGSLVRLESLDGKNWINEITILEVPADPEFWKLESPVVWVDSSSWNMVYTLTEVSETTIGSRLIQINSTDGVIWSEEYELQTILRNKLEYHQPHDKLLLTDRIELDEGVIFLGRFHSKEPYGEMEWKTGSIWFPEGTESNTAYLRSYTYTDHIEHSKKVQSVQFIRDLDERPMFIYSGEVLEGIHLGYIDDNMGLDTEFVVEP